MVKNDVTYVAMLADCIIPMAVLRTLLVSAINPACQCPLKVRWLK